MDELITNLAAMRTSLAVIGVALWAMVIFKVFGYDHRAVLHEIVDQLKQIAFKMK